MPQSKNINITPGGETPILHVSQGDIGRSIILNVKDGDSFYDLAGCAAALVGVKPSGLGFSVSGTVSGHTVTITTVKLMTAEHGKIACELRITKNGDRIGTANMILAVERDPHPDGTTDGNVDELIPEITVLVERAEAASSDAEAYGVGTRGGEALESTDPAYHNNSKYYQGEAASSATAAAGSASAASGSATAAAGSANSASGSATAASGSASAASGSATAADGSAKDAEAYAVGKRGGTDVGSSDPAYHNNAKYYKDEAANSASAASGSATAAAGSANSASGSATAASGSASAASGSATAADGSAKDAEAYAVGKRGGTDVGSSDPAYHNNAKYYAEQAHEDAEEIEELIHGLTVTGLWIDNEGYICF